MPKLILSMDGLVLNELDINTERLLIGRKQHCDVQIDNLAVSAEHALLRIIGPDVFLEDLNSTNGTLVNGRSIKKCILKDTDVIELGKYKIKFLLEGKAEAEKNYSDSYIGSEALKSIGLSESLNADHDESTNETSPDATILLQQPPQTIGVLRLLNGKKAGNEILLDNPITRIGKRGNQVISISKHPQGYFLRYVEGTPPLLNEEKIGTDAYLLKENDVLEISGIRLEFCTRA